MSLSAPFPEPTARALPRVCRIREIFSPVSQFHRPIHSSLPILFFNFLGYGVSVSCSIALIFVYYTKISICRIPAGPQPFFPPFHFPELLSLTRVTVVR